jgi:hypothetical protein
VRSVRPYIPVFVQPLAASALGGSTLAGLPLAGPLAASPIAGPGALAPDGVVALDASRAGVADCKVALPAYINGSNPFLLLLDQDQDPSFSPEALEALGVCLFSPAYLRWEGKPVVAIKGGTDILTSLSEAGWGDIQVWSLSSASFSQQLKDDQIPLWLGPGTALWDTDVKDPFFGHWAYVGSYVFFSSAEAEQEFLLSLQTDPLTQKALDAYLDAQTQINKIKDEQRILEDRLKAAAVIVETVRTKYKEDYDTLYAFHHREYTPLPLWFKRLGQLVKVMTGKRTLKSLIQRNKA